MRDQHIYSGISATLGKESDQYVSASSVLSFWCYLAIFCLIVEFIIIFGGKTLFNDKYNLMMVGLHCIGLLVSVLYMNTAAHYQTIKIVWAISCLAPLSIEILSYVYSSMNYRKQFLTA